MFTEGHIEEWNLAYKNAAPEVIVRKALELNESAVVTTNFRPYEAAILHAVSREASQIRVVVTYF